MESLAEGLDRFKEECLEMKRRMDALSEDLQRQKTQYGPPAGGALLAREEPPREPWEARFDRFERMLADVKQDVGGLKQDVGGLKQDVAGLKQDVGALKQDVAGLKQDVAGLKQDVQGLQGETGLIRERMATKVEVESLRDSIKVLSDGYSVTQASLTHVANLLKRYLVS